MHAFGKGLIWVIQIALVVLLAAWVRPVAVPEVEPIYLVSHGWHVGLVIRRTDATAAHWPEQEDFPDATFLEVGWGDRDYYQDPDPGVGKLLKAGLWPTKSVLHIVGFSRRVTAYFPRSEIIRIDVPEAGVDALAAYVHHAYARDDEGQPLALGPGLYGESRFYAGRQRYHVFKNCNTWAARALRAAGVRVRPAEILTADDLLAQARPFGETIQNAE
ncbi:MAG: DUF2459 domain-containing protein [Bacteroidetes bacterium]|nr:DUF2459 domain-containing protein [Bacteroidota bacterium]